MSDYMLLEYLKGNKALGMNDEDHKLVNDFKRYMNAKGRGMRGMRRDRYYDYEDYDDWDEYEDFHRARGYKRDAMQGGHFDEFTAKEIVSKMYHYENDKLIEGEHFSMHKAQEACMKHKDHLMHEVKPCDMYIAINAFYHDFISLFRSWFGVSTDEKIILLAITFWFKDEDYQGNKLMDYFNK